MLPVSVAILGFSVRSNFSNEITAATLISLIKKKKPGNYIIALNKVEAQSLPCLFLHHSGCFYVPEIHQLCAVQIMLFL